MTNKIVHKPIPVMHSIKPMDRGQLVLLLYTSILLDTEYKYKYKCPEVVCTIANDNAPVFSKIDFS
jgi:hypothetical protein